MTIGGEGARKKFRRKGGVGGCFARYGLVGLGIGFLLPKSNQIACH